MASGSKRVAAWLMSGLALAAAGVAIAGVFEPKVTSGMWGVVWAVTFASIVWVSIANAVARGAPRLVGWVGAGLALFGLVLTSVFALSPDDRRQTLIGLMFGADAVAALAAVVCQVALARVSRGGRWVAGLLLISAVAFDAGLVLAFWHLDLRWAEKAWGVVGILLVLSTVLLGVLHWLGAPRPADARCPRCAEPATAPTGEFACRACGTRFRVDLLP